jgi:hypothetical protein
MFSSSSANHRGTAIPWHVADRLVVGTFPIAALTFFISSRQQHLTAISLACCETLKTKTLLRRTPYFIAKRKHAPVP